MDKIKKYKLTHKDIAKAFGYRNVNSFRCSSAHKRIMRGVENILNLSDSRQIVTIHLDDLIDRQRRITK